MRNQKSLILVMALMVLLIGLTAISAADTSNNNVTSTAVSDNTVNTHTSDINKIAGDTKTSNDVKTVKAEAKNINNKVSSDTIKTETKSVKKTDSDITVNNDNFDNYFTNEGFTDNVQANSKINFGSDITRNNHSYVLNKPVTINGNGHTLTLNTTSGSYFGNETGSSFIVDNGAAGTSISNIKFYNTQVFVRNTSDVTINNIDVTVNNQRIGQGVGVFSIRDNSSFITVENSTFTTTNNSGSSSLVLAWANNCTLKNNTVTGTGNVGNLIYLTTYNVAGQSSNDITLNRGNKIINNTVTGPAASIICYGITLSGGDNFVENNTIYYAGQGITTQWMSTSTTNWTIGENYDRYVGNTYKNNKLYNGSSFLASLNSTIENNICSGTVTSGINSTLKNNNFTGTVNLQTGSNATENTITTLKALGNNTIIGNEITTLNITGSNVAMINNTGNTLYVKSGLANITSCNDNFSKINDLSEIIYCDGVQNNIIKKSKSLKQDNEIEWYEITITKDNYEQYLPEGTFDYTVVEGHPYTRIYMESLPINEFATTIAARAAKDYVYEFIGINNCTWNNCNFRLGNSINSNITVSNMTFNYNLKHEDPENMVVLQSVRSNTRLENITINATFTDSVDSNVYPVNIRFSQRGNNTLNNCNITLNIKHFNNPTDYNIQAIHIENYNNTISNCNINASVPSNYIDWDHTNHPASMVIYSQGTNTTLKNNNITITESQALNPDKHYNTLYGILLANNNTVVNNAIKITGSEYLYSIQVRGSNNNVSNNNINLTSVNYLSGIMMEGSGMSNNTIANNNITLNGGNRSEAESETGAEDSIYGISIENFGYGGYDYTPGTGNVTNNTVINNTIQATGYNVYGYEQFGGDNTTIANNTINLTGHTPMAIGIIGAYSNVTGNDITVNGPDNKTYSSADYLKPRTTGIYFAYGQENNATDNTIYCSNNAGIIIECDEEKGIIKSNTVYSSNNTYAVTLSGSNTEIANNALISKNSAGNDAVLASGEGNTITDNTGILKSNVTLTVNSTITGTVNTPTTITVNVASSNGLLVDEGTVKFIDSAGNLLGQQTVTAGTATLEYPFTTARARNILITYEENEDYYAQSTITTVIINKISAENITFTIDPINAKVNDIINITAKISNTNGTNINGGKVIFKVNGKTLRNNEGNIIYTTVTNGTANIEDFTVPKGWVGNNIQITAKYGGNSQYETAKATQTATITKATANIEITSDLAHTIAGKATTFSVKVTSNDKNVTGGQVLFKINGKTLRDSTNKVLYAQVENGVANLTYTIPANMPAKEYKFTCVYGNPLYERSDINSTLTIKTMYLCSGVTFTI